MKYKISIPTGAASIIEILQDNGYEAYVVGGCVRDSLLNKQPKDWDICTSATIQEISKVFGTIFKIIPTGVKFGTVTIIADDNVKYEVTTFRTDANYHTNRFPDVKFTKSLKEDLSRRDFTINAIAYNKSSGIIDLFGGMDDLRNRKIRCVGNPEERFEEDALRILRAWRLECQLSFNIEINTLNAMHEKSHLLKNISNERIGSEFRKAFDHTGKFVCSSIIHPWIINMIIPEWDEMHMPQNNKYHIYYADIHSINVLLDVADSNDIVLKLAAFLHDIGKPKCKVKGNDGYYHYYNHEEIGAKMSENILKRLGFNNNIIENVVELIRYHDQPVMASERNVKRWLSKMSEGKFRRLLRLKIADAKAHDPKCAAILIKNISDVEDVLNKVIEESKCFSLKDLAINGNDLISIGYKQGKEIGCCLDKLLHDVIDCNLKNNKDELMAVANAMLKGSRCMRSIINE